MFTALINYMVKVTGDEDVVGLVPCVNDTFMLTEALMSKLDYQEVQKLCPVEYTVGKWEGYGPLHLYSPVSSALRAKKSGLGKMSAM